MDKKISVVMDELSSYGLPAIQREFVWEKERIIQLFDSILQDYPIGNLLLWNKKLKTGESLNFDVYKFIMDYKKHYPHNETFNTDTKNEINLVLDGQQRLTSLAIGLMGSYSYLHYGKIKQEFLYINLISNIKNDQNNTYGYEYELEFKENKEILFKEDNKIWFKLSAIMKFKEKSTSEDIKEEYEDKIKDLVEKEFLKDAKRTLGHIFEIFCIKLMLTITIKNIDDDEKALDIFVRTNDGGKKLEKADLLLAYLEHKDSFKPNGARKEILDFVDSLNKEETDKQSYDFKKDDILKGCLVLSDLEVQYKLKNFKDENLKIISEEWNSIKKAYELTVKLLSKYGFRSESIISMNALIPIAYYLKLNNFKESDIESNNRDKFIIKNEIINWFIRASLTGAFGSSSDSTLKEVREKIKNKVSFSDIKKGKLISKEDVSEWMNKEKYRSKKSHLILLLISDNKNWGKNINQDHIFPKKLFNMDKYKEMNLSKEDMKYYNNNRDSVVNLNLINSSVNIVEKNDEDFEVWLNKLTDDGKKELFIPILNEYSFKNFKEFIEKRKDMMIKRISEILGAE